MLEISIEQSGFAVYTLRRRSDHTPHRPRGGRRDAQLHIFGPGPIFRGFAA